MGLGSALLVQNGAVVNMAGSGEKDMGGPMSNYGRVVMSGGSFYVITDNSTWLGSVVNLGLFEMAGDCSILQYFGNDLALFQNGGIFRKNASPRNRSLNMRLYNSYCSVERWSGVFSFHHGEQLGGAYLVPGG